MISGASCEHSTFIDDFAGSQKMNEIQVLNKANIEVSTWILGDFQLYKTGCLHLKVPYFIRSPAIRIFFMSSGQSAGLFIW